MLNNYFSSNLKYLRNKRGLEQKDISEMLGLKSPTSVTNWEKGTNMAKTGHLNDLANYFGVSFEDLVNTDLTSDKYEGNNSNQFNNEKVNLIPILGMVNAGTPNYAVEDVLGYMTAPPNVNSNSKMYYLEVSSDSMDKQFPVGSYVLIDSEANVQHGDVAVVKINGNEATLKQIKVDVYKHKIYLIPNSTNPSYFPEVLDSFENDITFSGKVVGVYQSI